MLFNLNVWFYFLCAIKRKIVAAITMSKAKSSNGFDQASLASVRTLTQPQARLERPSAIYTISVLFELLVRFSVCLFACGYGELDRFTWNAAMQREKEREKKQWRREKQEWKKASRQRDGMWMVCSSVVWKKWNVRDQYKSSPQHRSHIIQLRTF